MSREPEKVQPLPRVASSPGWTWYYFRVRYLPTVASGLTVMAAVWLWAMNLPESSSTERSVGAARKIDAGANVKHESVELVHTNLTDVRSTLTNDHAGIFARVG